MGKYSSYRLYRAKCDYEDILVGIWDPDIISVIQACKLPQNASYVYCQSPEDLALTVETLIEEVSQ